MVVFIVGAGPGDLGLVTLKAKALIEKAEVILYDKLVNPAVLEWAPAGCEIIYVGKREKGADPSQKIQKDINSLLVEYGKDNFVVRLGDVADIRIEAENTRRLARSNMVPGMSLGIVPQSQANILAVNRGVVAELERIKQNVPDDMQIAVAVDFSVFIGESMKEVVKALFIALAMVLIVIFLFLGSLRATAIPAVTIPVSIIASFMVMAVLGYSINTLTLLGLVLAIGLVVDDAIVVLENVVRHMEQGRPALLASSQVSTSRRRS